MMNWKKLLIFFTVLGILFYLAYPSFLFIKSTKDLANEYDLLEKVYKLSVIPMQKRAAAGLLQTVTFVEINKKYNYKTFSSKEAQKLISENIKWTDICIEYFKDDDMRYSSFANVLLEWARFDDALRYYNLAKEKDEKVGDLLVRIYIAKGEYQNAFKELNRVIINREISYKKTRDDLYLMAIIYTGLNEFEKAHQKIDEWYKYTNKTERYYAYKFFIYKKSGKEALAQEYYDKIQQIEKPSMYGDKTPEDLIFYLDRVYW